MLLERNMSWFNGGMLHYIEMYILSLDKKLIDLHLDYTIPQSSMDYLAENGEKVLKQIQTCKSVKEYSPELKEIAKQYLPIFLQENPNLKEEECFKF